MKMFIHDYAGYPFPLGLSRELAQRGHQVWHVHFHDIQQLKAGCMAETHNEGSLTILGLSLGEPFKKYTLFTRRKQDLRYAKLAAGQITAFRPDIVLSADTPLEIQKSLHEASRKVGARFYFWMQDFYSLGVLKLLPRRLPIVGRLIGNYYKHLERALLRKSDGVVLITDDFLPIVTSWGVDKGRCHVLENWAPLNNVVPKAAAEEWKAANDLRGKTILLYSGTLGMKHRPSLLIDLAQATEDKPDVVVTVVSAGPGAEWLRSRIELDSLQNLRVLPFQPIECVPFMLSAATILIGILEPDAGIFSVPSKVLTYLSAGKPILLSIPPENLAARIVSRIGAGIVTKPGHQEDWVNGALTLLARPDLRDQCSRAATRYAAEAFDITRIADQFEAILFPMSVPVKAVVAAESEIPLGAAAGA